MRLLRAYLSKAVTAVAVAGAMLAAAVTDGASAATVEQVYLQVNVCGNLCNHGDLAVVRNLAVTIDTHEPHAVTLNEVCENQYEWLRADLHAYRGRFDPTGPTCDNGARYGNAILVRAAAVAQLGTWQLPSPAGGEPRRLMCLTTRPPSNPSLIVCVTHISYVHDEIATQIGAVAGILRSWESTQAVLLGGDLNVEPADARLRALYSVRSTGGAFEDAGCDACPERRIDYVLLSGGHWSAVRVNAFDAVEGLSDHPALRATAVLAADRLTG